MLCLLAEAGLFQNIWTTNFDGLVARTAVEFNLTPVEVGFDCKERVFRQPAQNEIVCVSLHGDYRYDPLKNTDEELQAQEAKLRAALIATLKTHSLVVSGYSGRDPSVMEALQAALLQDHAKGKVFWCGFSDEPAENVAELLLAAKGKTAKPITCQVQRLMTSWLGLAHHCLEGAPLDAAKLILDEQRGGQRLQRATFSVAQANPHCNY